MNGKIYADADPDSDHVYRFMSDEFLLPQWREKADVIAAKHKEHLS